MTTSSFCFSFSYQIIGTAYGVTTCKVNPRLLCSSLGYTYYRDVVNDLKAIHIKVETNDDGTTYVKFSKEGVSNVSSEVSSSLG